MILSLFQSKLSPHRIVYRSKVPRGTINGAEVCIQTRHHFCLHISCDESTFDVGDEEHTDVHWVEDSTHSPGNPTDHKAQTKYSLFMKNL